MQNFDETPFSKQQLDRWKMINGEEKMCTSPVSVIDAGLSGSVEESVNEISHRKQGRDRGYWLRHWDWYTRMSCVKNWLFQLLVLECLEVLKNLWTNEISQCTEDNREKELGCWFTHTLHDPDDGIKRTVHEKVLLEELTVLVIGIGVSGSVEETVKEWNQSVHRQRGRERGCWLTHWPWWWNQRNRTRESVAWRTDCFSYWYWSVWKCWRNCEWMKSESAQTTTDRKMMLAHTLTLMVESKEPDTRRCCVKNSRHQMPLTWPFSTCSVCPVFMSHTRTVLSAPPLAIRSLSNVTDSTLRTKRTGRGVTHRPVTVVN